MDYSQALVYLDQLARFGSRLGLERMGELLRELGDPQESLRIIHVAGTNGKGSTCSSLAAILEAAGHSVGVYTSPHLSDVNERISVDGTPISDDDLARCLTDVRAATGRIPGRGSDPPTHFEVLTAAMYLHFAERGPDCVLQEVGLGGRLDATNAARCIHGSIITPVSLDHTQILGPDVRSIAREKAGILRASGTVVTGPQIHEAHEVISSRARDLGCTLFSMERAGCERTPGLSYRTRAVDETGGTFDLTCPGVGSPLEGLKTVLLGRHQIANAATAAAAAAIFGQTPHGLPVGGDAIRRGLMSARWPGRLETVGTGPRVVLDGAHNPAATSALAEAVKDIWPGRRVVLVFGAGNQKHWRAMLEPLLGLNPEVVFSPLPWGDHVDPAVASDTLPGSTFAVDVEGSLGQALNRAGPDDLVLITGSLYLVGMARRLLLG